MAEPKRDFVWLKCEVCGAKNYRTERRMKMDPKKKDRGKKEDKTACMEMGRLKMRKFCRVERKHTMHVESRTK